MEKTRTLWNWCVGSLLIVMISEWSILDGYLGYLFLAFIFMFVFVLTGSTLVVRHLKEPQEENKTI